MAKSAFRLALEEAIEQRHSAVHPWSEAWTSGKLDRRLLGEWVKQHFHYVSHFSEWLGAVYAACPHWDVQHFLLENITEEEGFVGSGDFAPVRHSELLLDFAETCGMKRAEILAAQVKGELLPETLGLQSWCAVQSTKPFVEALSGLLIGLESQVPRIYSKTTRRSWRSTALPRTRSPSSRSISSPTPSMARRASRSSRSTPRPTSSVPPACAWSRKPR